MFSISDTDTYTPGKLYLLGVVLLVSSLFMYFWLDKSSMFGPIGLTALILGLAEQERRLQESKRMNKLHMAAVAVLVTTASLVLISM